MRTRRFPDPARIEREAEANAESANGVGLDVLAWGEGTDEDGYRRGWDGQMGGRHGTPDARDRRETPSIVDALGFPGTVARAATGSLDKGREGGPAGYWYPADDPEGEAWALSTALLSHTWPVLRACRGARFVLVRVSLTASPGQDVRSPAVDFVAWVAAQPGGGAVLALDRRPRDGAEHWYGVALVRARIVVIERWRALTGANLNGQDVIVVRGWAEHVRGDSYKLRRKLFGALCYGLDLWPAQHGRRDLDRDVIACGVFAAPWRAARASAKGEGGPKPGDPPEAGELSRRCPQCERALPPGMRSDAKWCRPRCKNAAYRARRGT